MRVAVSRSKAATATGWAAEAVWVAAYFGLLLALGGKHREALWPSPWVGVPVVLFVLTLVAMAFPILPTKVSIVRAPPVAAGGGQTSSGATAVAVKSSFIVTVPEVHRRPVVQAPAVLPPPLEYQLEMLHAVLPKLRESGPEFDDATLDAVFLATVPERGFDVLYEASWCWLSADRVADGLAALVKQGVLQALDGGRYRIIADA